MACAAARFAIALAIFSTGPVALHTHPSLRGYRGPSVAVELPPADELSEDDMPSLAAEEEEAAWPQESSTEMADGDEIEPEDVVGGDFQEVTPEALADSVEHLTMVALLADTNNDTQLSADELRNFAERLRDMKRRDHTKAAMKHLDTNSDGIVTHTELGSPPRGGIDARRFAAADHNGDGSLDEAELHTFAHPEVHSGVLRMEADHQFTRFDIDGDGTISYNEFKREDEAEEDFSEEASHTDFLLHDADNSGGLDKAEFQHLLAGHALLNDSIGKAIAAADGDGDGHIDIHEEMPKAIHGLLGSEFIEDFFFHEYAHTKPHEEL